MNGGGRRSLITMSSHPAEVSFPHAVGITYRLSTDIFSLLAGEASNNSRRRRSTHPDTRVHSSRSAILWSSSSARSARSIHLLPGMTLSIPALTVTRVKPVDPSSALRYFMLRRNKIPTVGWLQPSWICSLQRLKIIRFGCPKTFSSLKSDKFFSFEERAFGTLSSHQWERSFSSLSSTMERVFLSPLPFSFMEELLDALSPNMPHLVDKLLADFETWLLKNSIGKDEFELWSDLLTDVMQDISDTTYIAIYGILQDCRVLKMYVISICLFSFYRSIGCVGLFSGNSTMTLINCCISKP